MIMKQTFKEKYIADGQFYNEIAKLALPMALQSFLSSSLEIIDSIMVAAIQMTTAVSNAGMFNLIYNYGTYGLGCGISIYSAQYYSSGDYKRLSKTFGFNVLASTLLGVLWILLFYLFGKQVLAFYLNDESIVYYGMQYLSIMIYSLPLRGLNNCFTYIYRCVGEQKYTLKITTLAGVINMIFNYLLIFGKFGFPCLGVQGAAYASIISIVVSLFFYISFAFKSKAPFIADPKEMFQFDRVFIQNIFNKSLPLIINEGVFAFGTTLFSKAYGYLGKEAMDAYYVGSQINNVFQFAIWGYGHASCIMLGHTLGRNEIEEAKKQCNYLHFITLVIGSFLTALIILFSKSLISLFSITDPSIYHMTQMILYVFAFKIMMRIFNYVNFAILRSGGESKVISYLDAGILWAVGIPLAFITILVLKINNIALVLLICQFEQFVRLVLGMKQIYSYRWANNLTN